MTVLLRALTDRWLESRERNAGDIASQRNADADERRSKKAELAEHNQTNQHGQANHQQERRPKQELVVRQSQKTENQPKQDEPHAMGCVEAHPTPPHGCLL